ncbi:MAG: hypothetical protein QXT45_05975 [Candidatus Bilamarchaeaceae archaeon]
MPDIFQSASGSVSEEIPLTNNQGYIYFYLSGWKDNPAVAFFRTLAKITGATIIAGETLQVAPTLSNDFFIYTFGNEPTIIEITGITLSDSCEHLHKARKSSVITAGISGIGDVWLYYKANRISSNLSPIYVSFGTGVAFYGFLVSIDISTRAELGISNFRMKIISFDSIKPPD